MVDKVMLSAIETLSACKLPILPSLASRDAADTSFSAASDVTDIEPADTLLADRPVSTSSSFRWPRVAVRVDVETLLSASKESADNE